MSNVDPLPPQPEMPPVGPEFPTNVPIVNLIGLDYDYVPPEEEP